MEKKKGRLFYAAVLLSSTTLLLSYCTLYLTFFFLVWIFCFTLRCMEAHFCYGILKKLIVSFHLTIQIFHAHNSVKKVRKKLRIARYKLIKIISFYLAFLAVFLLYFEFSSCNYYYYFLLLLLSQNEKR